MDNISLIISGNLTGFSRFYASPHANDICSEAKFDFDYRNYLTFLNNGEKAYAISFAPTVIAVSLVTRVLDSFRRPGILVVSILLHRNQKIENSVNSQNKKALYQLLNDITDKFYEKNFVNGMINQNASVLMQDYYTDIFANYVLVSDRSQRFVNSNIDVASLNKRLGYVASSEDHVALYLFSICRRSYEGYHHVFFSQNAPQNIEETPEEVVIYSVLVTNNNYHIPSVKLSDKIYNLHPNEGEIDCEKDYTYQQILGGETGTHIRASIKGELIELTYRFVQEERIINFVFKDVLDDVPFALVAPVIQYADGSRYNIPCESFAFQGKEIYARKELMSGSGKYQIKPESSHLDISRIQNGATCYVYVEQCFDFNYVFNQGYTENKTIILKRHNSDRPIVITNVKASVYEKLSGSPEEWEYSIESNDYEPVSGNVAALLQIGRLDFRRKVQVPMQQTRTSGHAIRTESKPVTSTTNASGSKVGITVLSGGAGVQNIGSSKDERKKNRHFLFIGVLAVVLVLLFGGIIWPGWFLNNEKEKVSGAGSDSIVKKRATFHFVDSDNQKIKIEDFSSWVNAGLISQPKIICADGINCDIIDNENKCFFCCIYKITGNTNNLDSIIEISLMLDSLNLISYSIPLGKIKDTTTVQLNILASDLNNYKKLKSLKDKNKQIDDEDWASYSDILVQIGIQRGKSDSFYLKFQKLLGDKPNSSKESTKEQKPKSVEVQYINNLLEQTYVTITAIEEQIKNPNEAEKKRIAAIKRALTDFQEKGYIESSKYLSKSQAGIVTRINNYYDKIKNNETDIKKFIGRAANCVSLSQAETLLPNN